MERFEFWMDTPTDYLFLRQFWQILKMGYLRVSDG